MGLFDIFHRDYEKEMQEYDERMKRNKLLLENQQGISFLSELGKEFWLMNEFYNRGEKENAFMVAERCAQIDIFDDDVVVRPSLIRAKEMLKKCIRNEDPEYDGDLAESFKRMIVQGKINRLEQCCNDEIKWLGSVSG